MDLSSLPSLGDAMKTVCDKVGLEDETSDWVVAGTCLATGDYLGAAKYGMECYDHVAPDLRHARTEDLHAVRGYDNTAEGWLEYMRTDPDAAMQAYYEAMVEGSLPDEAKTPEFQQMMNHLLMERNRQLTAMANLQQAIHDTLKQACNFRV